MLFAGCGHDLTAARPVTRRPWALESIWVIPHNLSIGSINARFCLVVHIHFATHLYSPHGDLQDSMLFRLSIQLCRVLYLSDLRREQIGSLRCVAGLLLGDATRWLGKGTAPGTTRWRGSLLAIDHHLSVASQVIVGSRDTSVDDSGWTSSSISRHGMVSAFPRHDGFRAAWSAQSGSGDGLSCPRSTSCPARTLPHHMASPSHLLERIRIE